MTTRTLGRLRRTDFPYYAAHPDVVYLDSGATSQRPETVISAEADFVRADYAAVHRGSSVATGEATWAFEAARERVGAFVGAGERELVWTAGATDAINMIALGISDASQGLGSAELALSAGDEIVVTEAEHHANLIPWQRLAARTGAVLRHVAVDADGLWSLDEMRGAVSSRTRLIAFPHVSNVTGQIAPVTDVVGVAAEVGALTVLDACQSVPHMPVDVSALGVDFAAFSAHKMLGPTGIGALYGRAELLDVLPPARTGGSMITTVTMDEAEFLPAPNRFEAGTQPVSQAIGFGAAADYLASLGMSDVRSHEEGIAQALVETVTRTPGVRLIGPAPGAERAAIASVIVDGVHAHDVGQFLDDRGVTIRTGHHCAQPLHRALGVPATVRASASVYTDIDDVSRFGEALGEVRDYFGVTT
ncbi:MULTISPECIES: SufS family cysteine desulfurase [unclassified Microbacterium]|uniref:SufS family cysteine desulfurase n=1 Tax=unclassified Microbacterium TaxID=2609290 RepID=UPI00097EBD6D|nr:SufS family cysteine desulfurase [Microbacterium sp. JB110]RCS62824.1 SufS family cysteine desulfurase [Microbacterium sp. JB110]SJM62342.1 Cysteine desulfurase, SufS subfamily [Frigoribacterium sp. JB110]